MSGKFLCVLTIVVVIAAITFNEAEACKSCGYDFCGCQAPAPVSYIPAAPLLPPPPMYPCHSCGHGCPAPMPWMPKTYCSPCLKKKHLRLVNSCGCSQQCC